MKPVQNTIYDIAGAMLRILKSTQQFTEPANFGDIEDACEASDYIQDVLLAGDNSAVPPEFVAVLHKLFDNWDLFGLESDGVFVRARYRAKVMFDRLYAAHREVFDKLATDQRLKGLIDPTAEAQAMAHGDAIH